MEVATATLDQPLENPWRPCASRGSEPRLADGATVATVGVTKNGRGQAVSLTWCIVEGEHEKRLVWQSILIQHDSEDAQRFGRQKFRDVCVACGITNQLEQLGRFNG